jgi:rod shape-determining protein MreC
MFRQLRTRSGISFLLVVLAIAALFLHQAGQLGPVEDAAFVILQPLQRALLDLSAGVGNLFGGFQEVNSLRARNKQLEDQVNELTIDTVRLKELEQENLNLREQLAYKQANPDFTFVGAEVLLRNPDLARVISQDPTNLTNYIIVDQGRAEGVREGMPVVTPRGLAGRVTEVGAHWAKVLLIIDSSSSVNAVVQSTRATGVAQGSLNGTIVVRYLPQGEAVAVNDIILTSGIGGNFPKRLVIGQVTEVHRRDIELFQEAVVKPSVDFNALEFVLIIKKFTPADITQEPTPTSAPTRRPTPMATETPSG